MAYPGDNSFNSNSGSNSGGSSSSSIPYEHIFSPASAPALGDLGCFASSVSTGSSFDPCLQSVQPVQPVQSVGIDPSLQPPAPGLDLYAVSLLDQPQYQVQDGPLLQPVNQPVHQPQQQILGPPPPPPQQQQKQLQLQKLQQATSGQQQRYLAVLHRSSPPRQEQARSHPLELVQRATSHYPAPACPPAMSSHPDHSMFPSYTFLTPNFVAEQSHQRRLRRSRTAAQAQQHPAASQAVMMPTSSPQLQLPRTPQTPQTQNPQIQNSQNTHTSHIQQPSFAGQSRKRQRSPPVHTSKRARTVQESPQWTAPAPAPSAGQLLPLSTAPMELESVQLQQPALPHPSISYLPLLGPATPTLGRSDAAKGKSVASSDLSSVWSPPTFRDAAEVDAQPASVNLQLQQDAVHHQPSSIIFSSPVVEETRPAISSVYVLLPYGHEAPVVKLLNQATFSGVIRGLLTMASAQQARGLAEDDMPAWQRNFVQKRTVLLHQGMPSFPAQQSFSSSYPTSFNTSSSFSSTSSYPSNQLPDTRLLMACVNMFSVHIMGVYPIIPRSRLRNVVGRFLERYGSAPSPGSTSTSTSTSAAQLSLVIDLFILALGSLCWAKLDGTAFEPGPGFFYEAQAILAALTTRQSHTVGGKGKGRADASTGTGLAEESVAGFPGLPPSLDLARAYLLAAMFCGQMAWLPEATQYIEEANVIIRFLIFQPSMVPGFGAVSLVEQNQRPHVLTVRERQLAVVYWTCVQLELAIKSEMGQTPSGLIRYQSLVPVPESDVFWPLASEAGVNDWDGHDGHGGHDGGSSGLDLDLDLGNLSAITTQVQLWRSLNTIYEEEYIWQRPAGVVKEAVARMKQQYEQSTALQPSSSSPSSPPSSPSLPPLPPLSLSPLSPDKSLVAARARALYCEGRSYGVLRCLQAHRQVAVADMAEVMLCLIDTIHAYHDLAHGNRILPSSFGVAMVQCRYLLLLFAASRSLAAAAAVVCDDLISELVTGTLASFQTTAGPPGVMEAARRVLRGMQAVLQPQQQQPLQQPQQPQPPQQPPPELSLYCPPFSTRPDILPAVPTATTVLSSSSFFSFRAPNTPQQCVPSSSAYDSPFVASPDSPATSCSPSPSCATFAPARRLFGAFHPDASVLSADSGYVSQPSSFPAPSVSMSVRPAAPVCDMAAFAHHIGLLG